MKSLVTLAALALSALAAPAFAAPDSGLRVKVAEVSDPSGFERPMRAASSLVPADWTVQGGVIWKAGGDCTSGQQANWSATSPDGRVAIQILPTVGWAANSMGYPVGADCFNANFNSADEFVAAWVGTLPGGRVLEVERNPDVSRMLAPLAWEMPGDPYSKFWADFASVKVEYRDGGVTYNAIVTLFTNHTYMASGYSYGNGFETGIGRASLITVYSAPKAEFDTWMPVFHLFSTNYTVDPTWSARVARVQSNIAADARRASADRSKIIADTYSDISDMSMDSWRKRQASDDYIGRETSEMIRGVETYNADTPTGQIELPYGYNSAWQLNDGTFVVTDDTFYDPWRDSGQEGTRLGVAD